MRVVSLFASALLALSLSACARSSEPPSGVSVEPQANGPSLQDTPKAATAAGVKSLDKKLFGAAITEKDSTSLASLVKEPAKFENQTVCTEGVVSAVCKSMGCWMEIADDSGQAHIKMAGHGFFVPREASGHRARIQGKVIPSAAAEDTCSAKDNCRENAEKETGRVAKVEIEATGIEFLD